MLVNIFMGFTHANPCWLMRSGPGHCSGSTESFIFLKSCKGQGNSVSPVPHFEVVLDIREKYGLEVDRGGLTKAYQDDIPVPLEKLQAMFTAIDLFPSSK